MFPVLNAVEAAQLASAGEVAPTPHPRLTRTPALPLPPYLPEEGLLKPGQHTVEVLIELGLGEEELKELLSTGSLGHASQDASPGLKPKL